MLKQNFCKTNISTFVTKYETSGNTNSEETFQDLLIFGTRV